MSFRGGSRGRGGFGGRGGGRFLFLSGAGVRDPVERQLGH